MKVRINLINIPIACRAVLHYNAYEVEMMAHSALSPYVRAALDYTVPSYWPFRERVILDYELLLVKAGEVVITVEGIAHHCFPGDLFLIKPGKTHMMEPRGSVAFWHPHVHFDAIEDETSASVKVNFVPFNELSKKDRGLIRIDILSLPPFELPDHIRLHNSVTAENMLLDIIQETQMQNPLFRERCKGLMIHLLVHLTREIRKDAALDMPQQQKAIERISLMMRNNLHQQLSLDVLAREAGYSKSHFSYLFAQAYGMSPLTYHKSLRMKKAQQLLANSSLPVTAIAELCGYTSLYAFSNAFKNDYRLSPYRFRQSIHRELVHEGDTQ